MSGRSRASPVWSYYSRDRGSSEAVCHICQTRVRTSNGGTTGLFFHLRRHHGIDSLLDPNMGIKAEGSYASQGVLAIGYSGANTSPRPPPSEGPPSERVVAIPFGNAPSYKPRSNASPVWNHFQRSLMGDKGICLHCGVDVAVPGGSTTGMFVHLRKHHPNIYVLIKPQVDDKWTKHIWSFYRRLDNENAACLTCGLHVPISVNSLQEHLSTAHPKEKVREQPECFLPSRDHPSQADNESVLVKSMLPQHVESLVLPVLASAHSDINSMGGMGDLVLHCVGGKVPAHRFILAALSSSLSRMLMQSGMQEENLILPDVSVDLAKEFMEIIYCGGKLDKEKFNNIIQILNIDKAFFDEEEHKIEENLGLVEEMDDIWENQDVKIEPIGEEDVIVEIPEEYHGSGSIETYEDVEDSNMGDLSSITYQPADSDHSINDNVDETDYDYSTDSQDFVKPNPMAMGLANDDEIEAAAQRIKNKIMAKFGLQRKRKPSQIWHYFYKTTDIITCKLCGIALKNSGNTTNAAHHLKQHPLQYNQFRADTEAQREGLMQKQRENQKTFVMQKEVWKRSIVWDYFQPMKSKGCCRCNFCFKMIKMAGGNTSGMILHLRHNHMDQYKMFMQRKGEGSGEHRKEVGHLQRERVDLGESLESDILGENCKMVTQYDWKQEDISQESENHMDQYKMLMQRNGEGSGENRNEIGQIEKKRGDFGESLDVSGKNYKVLAQNDLKQENISFESENHMDQYKMFMQKNGESSGEHRKEVVQIQKERVDLGQSLDMLGENSKMVAQNHRKQENICFESEDKNDKNSLGLPILGL